MPPPNRDKRMRRDRQQVFKRGNGGENDDVIINKDKLISNEVNQDET
jgi:hypothetical protein